MDGLRVNQGAKGDKDPLEMPREQVTRGRSKKFKEALQSLMLNYQENFGILGDQFGGCYNIIDVQKDQESEENIEGNIKLKSQV